MLLGLVGQDVWFVLAVQAGSSLAKQGSGREGYLHNLHILQSNQVRPITGNVPVSSVHVCQLL